MATVVINKAIKYCIYPNDEQQDQIARTFGCVRKVYNMGLELQQGLYASEMGSMSNWDLNSYCNRVWKEEQPYLKEIDKFALTNSLLDLCSAFKNFFEKRNGYPKFKSRKEHYKSYSTNVTNNNIAVRGSGKKGQIKLPKLGWVNANIHRQPGAAWKIKSATVSQNAAGKHFVSVLFEIQHSFDTTIPTIDKAIGLDYSSPHFYVSSDGEKADMPHYYRKAEARLAREQRRLSRMVKGSNNYEQQRHLIAILHEQVANQRKDFCHKLSRKITNSYDVVCVEDINLRGLAGSLRFGKATNDNGFGMFRTFLKYKLEETGKHYIVIDKWYPSTKTCHCCGAYNPDIVLGQVSWVCPDCGQHHDRDLNAAINIRNEGFRMLTEQTVA